MKISGIVKEHPLKFIISLLVSAGLIYYSFKDLEWAAFVSVLASVNYTYLALGGITLLLSNIFRGARWRLLLLPQKEIKTRFLYEATMMGYMGNNILPLKLGEVLRSIVVARRHDVSVSGVGASVVVERSLDVLSFLVMAGIYGIMVPSFPSSRLLAGLGLGTLVILIVLSLLLKSFQGHIREKVDAAADSMESRGKLKRAEHTRSIYTGLETLWNMPHPLQVFFHTFIVWGMYLMVTTLGLAAFDFGLSLIELLQISMALLVFSTISLALPAAPGYVGTYHAAVIAALQLFNIDYDGARAFAVVLHLINYLLYTPVGAWYLIKAGMTLDSATESVVQESDPSLS